MNGGSVSPNYRVIALKSKESQSLVNIDGFYLYKLPKNPAPVVNEHEAIRILDEFGDSAVLTYEEKTETNGLRTIVDSNRFHEEDGLMVGRDGALCVWTIYRCTRC